MVTEEALVLQLTPDPSALYDINELAPISLVDVELPSTNILKLALLDVVSILNWVLVRPKDTDWAFLRNDRMDSRMVNSVKL